MSCLFRFLSGGYLDVHSLPLVTIFFSCWVVFQAYGGYRKGLWAGLLSLAGFFVAYTVTAVWGAPLAAWLKNLGWSITLAYLAGFIGLYFIVQFVVADLPRLVFSSHFKHSHRQPLAGMLLGGLTGVCSGLLLVWAYSMIQAAIAVNAGKPVAVANKPSMVEAVAGKAMAEATKISAKAGGASPVQAEVMAKFVEQPQQSMSNLRRLGQSPELKEFVTSRDSQYYMQSNNLDGLIESPAFQRMINLPEIADMRALAQEEAKNTNPRAGLREGDKLIAEQIAGAWRRAREMRDDPRVKEVLSDPEVRQLLEKRDIPGLISNKKVQTLLPLLTGESATAAGVPVPDFNQPAVVEKSTEPAFRPSEPASAPAVVYKWRDDNGRVRYSNERPLDIDAEIIEY